MPENPSRTPNSMSPPRSTPEACSFCFWCRMTTGNTCRVIKWWMTSGSLRSAPHTAASCLGSDGWNSSSGSTSARFPLEMAAASSQSENVRRDARSANGPASWRSDRLSSTTILRTLASLRPSYR